MAAMIACKRAAQKLLSNPSRVVAASTQSAARAFNTNAQMREADDDERGIAVTRRGERGRVARRRRDEDLPDLFSGVFDPFNPTRSLSQVLNMMDQMMDGPFAAAARGGARRGWDAREDNEALHLRIDMPGLGKEHVRVSAENNTLIIKGEGEKEGEGEEGETAGRRYSSRIELPEGLYKMEGIRAEMKNGVLKVVVPKVKEEERKDVFQVNVD